MLLAAALGSWLGPNELWLEPALGMLLRDTVGTILGTGFVGPRLGFPLEFTGELDSLGRDVGGPGVQLGAPVVVAGGAVGDLLGMKVGAVLGLPVGCL